MKHLALLLLVIASPGFAQVHFSCTPATPCGESGTAVTGQEPFAVAPEGLLTGPIAGTFNFPKGTKCVDQGDTVVCTMPDGKPTEEEISAALSSNNDIQLHFAFYLKPGYEYAYFDSPLISKVCDDLAAIAGEDGTAKFIEDSAKLKEDFGNLDAFDDTLRRNWLM